MVDVNNTNVLNIIVVQKGKIMNKKFGKSKNNRWLNVCRDFVCENKAISRIGGFAVLYCIFCVLLKCSSKYNVPIGLYPWGEFLFNVAISIIASVFFYIVQVFIPNRKREQVLKTYAKKYINQVLLIECNKLQIQINKIYNGEKTEQELKDAIDSTCSKIENTSKELLNMYFSVLSDDMIEMLNGILFDDFFSLLHMRAKGVLLGKSMESIVDDFTENYFSEKYTEKIKLEVRKMRE